MSTPSPSQQKLPASQSAPLRSAVSDAAADAARGAVLAASSALRRESGTASVAAAAAATASSKGDAALENAVGRSRKRVPEALASSSAAAAVVLHNLEPLLAAVGMSANERETVK